jgi:hypothetical protein
MKRNAIIRKLRRGLMAAPTLYRESPCIVCGKIMQQSYRHGTGTRRLWCSWSCRTRDRRLYREAFAAMEHACCGFCAVEGNPYRLARGPMRHDNG